MPTPSPARRQLSAPLLIGAAVLLAIVGLRLLLDSHHQTVRHASASRPTAAPPLPPARTPHPSPPPSPAPADPAPTAAMPVGVGSPPNKIAATVVDRMYSFNASTPGPNAWLPKVRKYLTPQAFAYYRQLLGPGPGSTAAPAWRQMVTDHGSQVTTAGNIHPAPSSTATNTGHHLTLAVPYSVKVTGFRTDFGQGTDEVYVNLIKQPGHGPAAGWKVAAVLPADALPPHYATIADKPLTPSH